MGEPGRRLTRAEEEIIIAQKQSYNDINLRAGVAGPPAPPQAVNARSALDTLGNLFGGAGYKIDPEALAAHIRTFKDIRDQSTAQYAALIAAAASATPPSFDEPALGQVKATQTSLQTAANENRAIAVYAQGLIDALEKANGTYVQREDDTHQVFNAAQGDSNPLLRK